MDKTNSLYLVLGWLGAILSQIIIWWNVRCHKKRDACLLLFSELRDIASRLIATYSKIQIHLGEHDKEALTWRSVMSKKYADKQTWAIFKEFDEKIKSATDEEIKLASQILKADGEISLSLKEYQLFSSNYILENLSLFDSAFQKKILDIKFQVNVFNEEVKNAIYFYRLTFDVSSMNVNKDTILENMRSTYLTLMKISRDITEKIDGVLQS
ncbi:MAG: hypothetical protein KAJ18_03490 [Candidatus Omnitrophica bacterium]|nr:hypothetical protein [Candidatus Omnitrophota bacterium]